VRIDRIRLGELDRWRCQNLAPCRGLTPARGIPTTASAFTS
jgi:hypothetical protein